ncbi:MAG: TetR/AcrR family transcriptional regulator [Rhodospirillaceae bacterium]|nr:TetR/AcrR family transcriptional regulator [Rhodospirillaceae bacterium]
MIAEQLQQNKTGLRERNKQDKLHRIKSAARELFIEKGFDQATVRQISTRAGVAFGTVFRYASNKRDLLFLIYNDELDELSDTAFLNIDPSLSFLDQLISIFRKFYQFFAERPELARDVLREMNFYEEGSQANRFKDGIRRIEIQMEDFVGENRAQNRISTDADKRIIALLLFGVYRTEVRRWLSRSELDVDKGMERLRPYLEVVIAGLGPGKNAL